MNYESNTDRLSVTTQRAGNDQNNGTASSQIFASTNVANYKGTSRQVLFLGEQPATQQEAQLRLKHAVGLLNLDVLEATVTVPGWLRDDGSLWISLVGDGAPTPVTINSPMLFPSTGGQSPSPGLFIKGVKHIQDNQGGTRSEIICCIQTGLTGGGDAIGFRVTRSQMQAEAIKHSVTGEASLRVSLASGLKPVGGVSTKGDLFREIRLDRAPLPLANTTG
jgi:hypothetical protein